MSILSTVEAVALDIEGEIKKAWNYVEGQAVKDAQTLWNDAKAIIISIMPDEYVILKALISRLEIDLATLNLPDAETAVLNAASDEERLIITKVGSPLLQTLIAMIKKL